MTLPPGSRLGPYEILSPIGAGGMGEVYKARDTRLDRIVAVKTLPPLVAKAPEFRERFEREAKAISQLNHANICTLFDVGEAASPQPAALSPDAIPYLVMEYLEGETLAARIAKAPIPFTQALTWAIQIAGALHAAHRQGILHRDLKPGNVIVTPAGVKLLDFGLAKIAAVGTTSGVAPVTAPPTMTTPLTAQGTILGTFQYMAPEMVEGEEADARADIWAFGCVLFEMLTGRRAFVGKTQASLFGAILKEDAPSVSAAQPLIPPALDRIVRTCLAKDPDQRVQSAHDLLLNLQWVAEGGSAAGTPAPVLARRKSRERMLMSGLALLVAVAAAAAAWTLKPAPQQTRTVTRFVHTLQDKQLFTRPGRHVIAMAPDGSFFIYVANQQLWLRRMNEVLAQPIKGTEEDPLDPAISPDGQWVAYDVPMPGAAAGSTLKKIPVTGGAPIVLASALPSLSSGLSWVGDTIAVGQGNGGVAIIPAGGGQLKTIVTLEKDEGSATQPQLLDDGKTVLFSFLKKTVGSWEQADIVVQAADGGAGAKPARRVVVEGGHDGRVLPGGYLVYVRDNTLFGVRFDAARGQRTGDAVPLIVGVQEVGQGGSTGPGHFGVSAEGRIAYIPAQGQANAMIRRTLTWVDRSGKETPIPAESREFIYARVAPGGKKIALDALDGTRDIWIYDLEHDILSRMTLEGDKTEKRMPVWAPDGRSVFYTSTEGSRAVMLRRASDGTGTPEKLGESNADQSVPTSVSPDGQQLLFTTNLPTYDVKLMPLAGDHTVKTLMGTQKLETNGEVSPDGRWLAYESDESGRNEIYVRPFPDVDGGRWQISTGGGDKAAWSRNSKELYYEVPRQTMMAVPVTAGAGKEFTYGKPVPLFSVKPYYFGRTSGRNQLIGRQYDVAADGRFVMIKEPPDTVTELPTIVVVEHWIDEVRKRLGQ
jgi:eukaryotic-like serine/threonine-protein kinase